MSPQLIAVLGDLQAERKREALAKWEGQVPLLSFQDGAVPEVPGSEPGDSLGAPPAAAHERLLLASDAHGRIEKDKMCHLSRGHRENHRASRASAAPIHDDVVPRVQKNRDEVINLPEKIAREKDIKLIICIDEFQNISEFENPGAFQKLMRSYWQKHKNVSYCLYGSKRHMMMDVFTNASMPFYKFGDILFLEKISEPDWIRFITERFAQTGKKIEPGAALEIARLTENHPYYVQQLAPKLAAHIKNMP